MAYMLFNLRHVPEEEAGEVRDLLNDQEVLFYETPPSLWGISAGAIWLSRNEDIARARQLMADYQARRGAHQRALFADQRAAGEAPTFRSRLRHHPLGVLSALVLATGLLLLMLVPFWIFV